MSSSVRKGKSGKAVEETFPSVCDAYGKWCGLSDVFAFVIYFWKRVMKHLVWRPVIFVSRVIIWDFERPQKTTRGKCETGITGVPSAILPLRSRELKFLNSQDT